MNIKSSWALTISLLVIIFLGFYAWRPFVFGFYADDWYIFAHSYANSKSDFAHLLSQNPDRPVNVILRYLLFKLWDGSPFMGQIYNSIFQAINVLAFGALLYFMPIINKNKLAIFSGCCLLILAPWTLGVTAWLSVGISAFASIFFSLAGICVIQYHNSQKNKYFMGFIIFMLMSMLTYQAYIFLFFLFPFLFASFLYYENKHISFKPLIKILAAIILIIIIVSVHSSGGSNKNITIDPLFMLHNGFELIKFFTGQGFNIGSIRLESLVHLLWILIFSICIFFYFRQTQANTQKDRAFIICACIFLAGIFAATLPFSLSGGELSLTGTASRRTWGGTIWLAIFLATIVSFFQRLPKKWYIVCFTSLILYFIICGVLLIHFSLHWRDASIEQQRIISMVKQSDLEKIDCSKQAFVKIDVMDHLNNIPVFQAYWDITSALHIEFKDFFAQCEVQVLFSPNRETTWDGEFYTMTTSSLDPKVFNHKETKGDSKIFTYQRKVHILRIKTDNVYIYNLEDGIFIKATEPF